MGNRASVLDGIGQDIAEPETMPKLIIQDQTPFFYDENPLFLQDENCSQI